MSVGSAATPARPRERIALRFEHDVEYSRRHYNTWEKVGATPPALEAASPNE